jgi:predicted nucleotidyltransferase component of viral defense system
MPGCKCNAAVPGVGCVNEKVVKNVAGSIHQRLLNLSRERGDDFNMILIRFAAERLLYRLSVSEYSDQFILKGAMLFAVWSKSPHRSTRDLDFLATGAPDPARFQNLFESLCRILLPDDGLRYDPKTIRLEEIREPDEYKGFRIRMKAYLGEVPISVQADIGFGDVVTPDSRIIEYPTLLDLPTPKLQAYPPETVVAEKFHTMVKLGIANSRMKDFYDVYVLSRLFRFDQKQLSSAIKATFKRRRTKIPEGQPFSLSNEFADDKVKSAQWNAFIKKNSVQDAPMEFKKIIKGLREFFLLYIRQ